MKIPKKLDQSRGCFYQLPDSISNGEMLAYEIFYRRRYKEAVFAVVGTTIFFQLASTRDKDVFLSLLESSCLQQGILIERCYL